MIKITEKWRIDNKDTSNLTLQERKRKKDKKTGETIEHWVDEGYYGSLEGLFRGFLNRYASSDVKDVNEVLIKINEVKKLFSDITSMEK